MKNCKSGKKIDEGKDGSLVLKALLLGGGTKLAGFLQARSSVFASKAETKNRSILTKSVDDAKRGVFFIVGKDLIQEDLDDLQDG